MSAFKLKLRRSERPAFVASGAVITLALIFFLSGVLAEARVGDYLKMEG
jgi:hypothetical protein